jgi:hypothetical protein
MIGVAGGLYLSDAVAALRDWAKAEPTQATQTTQAPVSISTVLTVDAQTYTAAVSEGATAIDVMNAVAASHPEFTYSGKEYEGMGLLVETINDVTNDTAANTYWTFYVNGAMAQVGASSYQVQQNDQLEWKYETVAF